MAKQYRQLDSGLVVPDWMPDMWPRRRIGSPKEFMFTPSGACGCDCTPPNPCLIFADNFSTDDLAANWTQQSGSWSISSGALTTSSSNAVLLCNTSCSDCPSGNYVIEVSIKAVTGNRNRIYFGTSNYVEIYWNGSSSTVSVGTTTKTISFTNGTVYSFYVCVSSVGVQVNTDASLCMLEASAASSDTVCGLGTGTVGNASYFTDFKVQRSGKDVTGCPQCSRGCPYGSSYWCTGSPSEEVQLTIPTFLPGASTGNCSFCADLGNTKLLKLATRTSEVPTWASDYVASCGCAWFYEYQPHLGPCTLYGNVGYANGWLLVPYGIVGGGAPPAMTVQLSLSFPGNSYSEWQGYASITSCSSFSGTFGFVQGADYLCDKDNTHYGFYGTSIGVLAL